MIRLSSFLCVVTMSVLLGLLSAGCGSERGIIQPTVGEQVDLTGDLGLVAIQLQAAGVTGDSSAYHDGHGEGPHRGTELSSLTLTFDAIRIYPTCADSDRVGVENGNPDHDREGDCDGSAECGYVEVLTDPITVELSILGETLTELLGALDVPSGEYSHLSLHIPTAEATTVDGETVEVTIANRDKMLKVRFSFAIEEGMVTEIAIVIDLSRSVREVPPGSGDFVLIPILHGEDWGQHEPGQEDQHGNGQQGGNRRQGGGSGEGGSGGGDGTGGGNGTGGGKRHTGA